MTRDELQELVRQVAEDGFHHPHLEVHCHMALRKLEELIEQNEATHEPMDWKVFGIDESLAHAREHIRNVGPLTGRDILEAPDPTDHLLHAACRLIMAIQLREEARNKS